MDIIKIVAVSTLAAIVVCLVRQTKAEFATAVTVGASCVVLSLVCDKLFEVIYSFYDLSMQSGIDSRAINCIIKVVGIGYVAEFGNDVCVDSGCKSLGDKVLLASKVAILLCALPVVTQLFDTIKGLVS